MIDKLQYLGEVEHKHMHIKDSPFLSDNTLPFNQVYYKLIRSGENIEHQWFVSQNEEYLEEGNVYTERKYSGVVNVLNKLLEEWKSV